MVSRVYNNSKPNLPDITLQLNVPLEIRPSVYISTLSISVLVFKSAQMRAAKNNPICVNICLSVSLVLFQCPSIMKGGEIGWTGDERRMGKQGIT